MTEPTRRATFSSTRGAILATAGVAIGLGNIWRFPYMMGQYGGIIFLLMYLLIIIAFGIPALMTEWVLGRHTRLGTWGAFQKTGLPGGKFWSVLLLLTVVMAASYYGVVLAMVLYNVYFYSLCIVQSSEMTSPTSPSTGMLMVFVLLTVVSGCTCLYFGVRRGIEKVSMLALPFFFLIFAILIVRVLTLDGAIAGLREFLIPRWDHFKSSTPLAAMGQAFFSLGLGGTFMITYGSYMRNEEDIPKSALWTAGADVGAALLAGMVIVPATFAFQIPLNSGPPLMFEVMPSVFEHISYSAIWGFIFFLSIFLIAMLSLIAAYEVVVTACVDALGWKRSTILMMVFVVQVLLSFPAIFIDRYIEYSDLIWGTTMQPIGSVITVIAVAWCMQRSTVLKQLRSHTQLPIPDWLFYWIKFGIPIAAITILLYGWMQD